MLLLIGYLNLLLLIILILEPYYYSHIISYYLQLVVVMVMGTIRLFAHNSWCRLAKEKPSPNPVWRAIWEIIWETLDCFSTPWRKHTPPARCWQLAARTSAAYFYDGRDNVKRQWPLCEEGPVSDWGVALESNLVELLGTSERTRHAEKKQWLTRHHCHHLSALPGFQCLWTLFRFAMFAMFEKNNGKKW